MYEALNDGDIQLTVGPVVAATDAADFFAVAFQEKRTSARPIVLAIGGDERVSACSLPLRDQPGGHDGLSESGRSR